MTDPIHFYKNDCNENCIWVRVTTIYQNQSKNKIKLELDFSRDHFKKGCISFLFQLNIMETTVLVGEKNN